MNWKVEFLEAAQADLDELDGSVRKIVLAGIAKVSQNPLPKSEGGYGNPLGNTSANNLTGLFKIKYLKIGIRVVYALQRTESIMKIIVISARADNKVYDEAAKRWTR